MFVATVDGEFAGMVHLVGKRQGTFKISPLIVVKRFQGKLGLGSRLLSFAENYARQRRARQLYCTVAELNYAAMQFFERRGFIHAGMSDSHYKVGMREHMLYKLLESDDLVHEREAPNLSVLPFDDRYAEQTKGLILGSGLPGDFDGVDEIWVHALFEGYRRRGTGDINTKYKLIYIVADRAERVLGVAGATPKKGEPIKVMPLVAQTHQAFEALLHELPWHLQKYGHKLYTHLNPTVEQTITLQRLGWILDAAMPASYRRDRVTQQWSKSLEGGVMRTMRVKKRFFDLIMSGEKSLEVRVAYPNIRTIAVGERIQLATSNESHVIVVKDVRTYPDFVSMLSRESGRKIAPDHKGSVLDLLQSIYPPYKESLGVVVLQIEPEAR